MIVSVSSNGVGFQTWFKRIYKPDISTPLNVGHQYGQATQYPSVSRKKALTRYQTNLPSARNKKLDHVEISCAYMGYPNINTMKSVT